MIKNEYLTVAELGKQNKMTTRNVRKIINELSEHKGEELLFKDKNRRWRVHQLLKHKFKRKRGKTERYFAFSFDVYSNYSENDIKNIMRYVFNQVDDQDLEINYIVEYKKANGQPHIHSYIKSTSKKVEVLKNLKLIFSEMSFHEQTVYDLERWKKYITKDGSPIITIKKEKDGTN